MDNDRKAAWTCIKCRQLKPQQKKSNTPTMQKKSLVAAITPHEITNVPAVNSEERSAALLHQAPEKSSVLPSEQLPTLNIPDLKLSDRDYVTIRKPKQKQQQFWPEVLSDPETDTELVGDTILDISSRSLPNISGTDNSQIEELRAEVGALSIQLTSAHQEIDRLNMELAGLGKKLVDQQKKGDIYKKLLIDKGPIIKLTPLKKEMFARKNNLEVLDSDDDTPQFLSPARSLCNDPILHLNQETQTTKSVLTLNATSNLEDSQHSLQLESAASAGTPKAYVIDNKQLNNDKLDISKTFHHIVSRSASDSDYRRKNIDYKKIYAEQFRDDYDNRKNQGLAKRKVVVVTDQRGKNSGVLLNNAFGEFFDTFCYSSPGASTKHVLRPLSNSNLLLTKDDFVIIMTGTNDKDPNETFANLYYVVDKYKNTNIFLTSILHNRYLNENKLNRMLYFIKTRNEHCDFMQFDNDNTKWGYRIGTSRNNIVYHMFHAIACKLYTPKYEIELLRRNIIQKRMSSLKKCEIRHLDQNFIGKSIVEKQEGTKTIKFFRP